MVTKDAAGSTLRLSDLLGQPALDADHRPLGRVVDLAVELNAPHATVRQIALGTGRQVTHLLPQAVTGDPVPPVLGSSVDASDLPRHVAGRPPALHDREVLLARDVLDTQVVDLNGHRLCRVSDVVLVCRPDGVTEVVAVDVGFGALLRRVGLRRLGARLAPVLVDWDDLHLTSSRGHLVQLNTATSGLRRLDATGLAELVARLSTSQAVDVLGAVDPAISASAFTVSHHSHQRRLLRRLPADQVTSVTAAGPPELRRRVRDIITTPARRRSLRTSGWRLHRPHPAAADPPEGRR